MAKSIFSAPCMIACALLVMASCISTSAQDTGISPPSVARDEPETADGDENEKPRKEKLTVEDTLPGILREKPTAIDLTRWKVTLPVNEDGEISGQGDAVELTRPAGFALPPYYDVQPGSITFMAPTDGARTGGSNYPRSELREMDGNGDEYEWTVADGGRLGATLKVNELPKARDDLPSRVVVGQIHGPDDELCRIYYTDKGEVYFIDDKAEEETEETIYKLTSADGKEPSIPLGATFSYKIDANAERLMVTVTHDDIDYVGTDRISAFWPGKPLYFKAGAYVQVGKPGTKARTVGDGVGSVTFFAITPPTHDIYHEAPREDEVASVEELSRPTSEERRKGKAVSNVEIYAGCVIVKTVKLLEKGITYQQAAAQARPLCTTLDREFGPSEVAQIDDVISKVFKSPQ